MISNIDFLRKCLEKRTRLSSHFCQGAKRKSIPVGLIKRPQWSGNHTLGAFVTKALSILQPLRDKEIIACPKPEALVVKYAKLYNGGEL